MSESGAPDAAPDAAPGVGPESQPGWRASGRDVATVSVLAVAIVLGAAAVTGFLPDEVQRIVFHTPLAIAVLVIGTSWVLYRIARPGR